MESADNEVAGIDQVVQVLVPDDPRRAAEKALGHLRADTRAHTGAVFAIADGECLRLRFTAGSIDQIVLDQAHEGWKSGRSDLDAGGWWQGGSAAAHDETPLDATPARPCLLVPLRNGDRLAGLLYLDFLSLERLCESDERTILRIGRVLVACVAAPETGFREDDLASHLARTSARELRQAQLVAHLASTGGNIKEVARRMGKSRPTIYAWMDEFRIPRRRENGPSPAER